ncbi:MAG TPA: hypothetical protein VE172_12945 [Stackebrandtia sp.]|uniref:hypothetical protein n=1 Tax=Stackebrandtia sp. TaxID=2023065 RepID=UPI002D60D9EA|nr:hypothetical protein [Stackebrandtia sp.]HZE39708.1 hypothetical protein [Stackebrandtia sp.]
MQQVAVDGEESALLTVTELGLQASREAASRQPCEAEADAAVIGRQRRQQAITRFD